jgi:hypothetical protein
MNKSILDQFAADTINAPVAVTGGGGGKGSKKKSTKRKSGRHKSGGHHC